jgi:hypothetical protein
LTNFFDGSSASLTTEITLPNPNNTPPNFPQRAINNFVACHIVGEFAQPKSESTLWCIRESAFLMSMPEAAIDKKSDAMFWKDEIRFAE